jgi:hypothetical protein
MTDNLNSRIDSLRRTRISLRGGIDLAWRDPDPGYRSQRVEALTLALRSTDELWEKLQAEQEARSDRIALDQLRHQTTRSAASVRRTVPTYVTRDMKPGR